MNPKITSVDIFILTLNEEEYIQNCINSVLSFNQPSNCKITIYVIDGGSNDKTLEIVENFQKKGILKVLHNCKKTQSAGMNLGISNSSGEYIMRLDAHSVFHKNYLKNCLETALRTGAENVGGIINTLPGSNKYSAKIVQALTSHFFGIGNSGFRTGREEGESDTVPFGFFKREIFDEIGLFDERLLRAQDYEFNCRMKEYNKKIWLNPSITCDYFNQPDLISFLKKTFFQEAPFNAYMWFFARYSFSLRHSITLFFFLGLIVGPILSYFSASINFLFMLILFIYLLLAVFSSAQLSIRDSEPLHLLSMPLSFLAFHFIHGFGIFIGLINILLGRIPKH